MQSEIKIYEVGGSIRDSLLGIPCKDHDYCVIAPSFEGMKDYLLERGAVIYLERPQYFAIRCKLPGIGDADFTLARKEGFYSDGRRPDQVFICETIEEELCRRDFTVGAMARGEDGVIIDPFNGQKDLENNWLRCVGNARERFSEDYLRLLRAIRFHIVKGFDLDHTIIECFEDFDLVQNLKKVSKERIYEELRKCFEHDSKKTLDFFRKYFILETVIFGDCEVKLIPKI